MEEGAGAGGNKPRMEGGPGGRGGGTTTPGAGGNWRAIAKVTSCQDNTWGHRCPSPSNQT